MNEQGRRRGVVKSEWGIDQVSCLTEVNCVSATGASGE